MSKKYDAIVIGTSAGGLSAITLLLADLPVDYPIPIIITQHRSKDQKDLLEEVLQNKCKIMITQGNEKETVKSGTVYIAPPGYHLLIESDKTFSLSSDDYVMYSRPSIDVMFETAADAYADALVGIILTGANSDGAAGITRIKRMGGFTVAQTPSEAQFPAMPLAAIDAGGIDHIWTLAQIQKFLLQLPTIKKD